MAGTALAESGSPLALSSRLPGARLEPLLVARPVLLNAIHDDRAALHVYGIMTLPANDAFTLGLPHDHARIGLRSSTKIPFVSSPKARSPSASVRRRDSQLPREMSVEIPDSPARSPPPHALQQSQSQHSTSNGFANGAPLRQRKKPRTTSVSPSTSHTAKSSGVAKPPQKSKVDWEIPRKTLHSSIGMWPAILHPVA